MHKRPVAMIDVDDTLIFGVQNERLETSIRYNDTLINSLKEKGIRDIILLTDMTLKKRTVNERLELITHLKKNGFRVHGVIIPSDISWGHIPDSKINEFLEMPYEGKGWYGEEFEEYVNENYNHFHPTLTQYQPTTCWLGQAFADATQALKVPGTSLDKLLAKSEVAKICGDHLGHKYKYPHTKGLLLDIFIHTLPKWVSEIVVADDNRKVCETVKNFRSTNEYLDIPPITLIEINGENSEDKTGYKDFDNKYGSLDKNLSSLLIKEISNEITRLQFGLNPLKSTSKYKVKALEHLIDIIKSPPTEAKDIKDIVDLWKKNNILFKRGNNQQVCINEVISQKRGFFSCDESTKTAQFISKFLKEHGSQKLQLNIEQSFSANLSQ